eukprot:565193-Amphidinium_carterae.1
MPLVAPRSRDLSHAGTTRLCCCKPTCNKTHSKARKNSYCYYSLCNIWQSVGWQVRLITASRATG